MVEAGARAIERIKCASEYEFEDSLQSRTLMNIRRNEARAALEAALPLIVAKERERAARIAEREVAAMRAAQMEFGGVGSGNPAAVYCQTRGQVAMEIAATIRSGNGGE
jgi:putative hemolysin